MAVAYLIIPVQPALQTGPAFCGRPGVASFSLAGLGGLSGPAIPTVPTDIRRSKGISLPDGKSSAVGSTPLPLLVLPAGLSVTQPSVTSPLVTPPAVTGRVGVTENLTGSTATSPALGTNASTGMLVLVVCWFSRG